MPDDRSRWDRILDKLGQKEEQALLIGSVLGGLPILLATFGHDGAANMLRENWEPLLGVVAALIGPAFASNVARGRQRGEAAARRLSGLLHSGSTSNSSTTQTSGGGLDDYGRRDNRADAERSSRVFAGGHHPAAKRPLHSQHGPAR